ncbi:MAG TPA: alpha/beta hydrolase [Pseudonocardiaceae bacterium]
MHAPALFVHGRDDKVIPPSASETAAVAMPNARLVMIEECGHWVQIEHTDEFCRLVVEFLEEDK